jgi:hypothetical protein
MRSSSVVAALALASVCSVGCRRGAYEADVGALCDAEQRAPGQGATRLERLDRAVIAIGPTLRTPEGKKLAARLMGSDVDPGKALQVEAARAGVKPCALAAAYVEERERVRWEHDLRELCTWKLDDLAGQPFLTERGTKLYDALRGLEDGARRVRLQEAAKGAGITPCAQAKAR